MKISVIGAGNVGATCADVVARGGYANEVVLLDIKDGLSEDSEKDAEADLQKVHDKYIKKIEDLLSDKQKEIMTV